MGNPMMQAQNVTPGMKIAFDIMGDTVCITPHEVKVGDSACAFWSKTAHRIIVEPWTMVEVLSSPVPEPSIIGSRVLAGENAFLRVSDAVPNSSAWVNIISGNRYTWATLCDLFGPITVLDDNPAWSVDSRKTEPETVESLDDADPEMVYADNNDDLWVVRGESASACWTLYEVNYGAMPCPVLQPFEPVARKVNK